MGRLAWQTMFRSICQCNHTVNIMSWQVRNFHMHAMCVFTVWLLTTTTYCHGGSGHQGCWKSLGVVVLRDEPMMSHTKTGFSILNSILCQRQVKLGLYFASIASFTVFWTSHMTSDDQHTVHSVIHGRQVLRQVLMLYFEGKQVCEIRGLTLAIAAKFCEHGG